MSLLLYGIVEADRPQRLGRVAGVEGRPVRPVIEQRLAALVSDHADRPGFSAEVAWAFEAVLEAAMEHGAVLPVRFGTMLDDEEAVQAVLRSRAGELGESLESVRGAVEVSLRARWTDDPAAEPAGSGSEYLRVRIERDRRAERLRARVEEAVGAIARDSRYRAANASLPLRAAYLVDRGRATELVDRVVALQRELEGAELSCTGPWPPFSFVGGQARG